MDYTIKVGNQEVPALEVNAQAGFVTINGVPLLPHEADVFGQALQDCATRAEALSRKARADFDLFRSGIAA